MITPAPTRTNNPSVAMVSDMLKAKLSPITSTASSTPEEPAAVASLAVTFDRTSDEPRLARMKLRVVSQADNE